MSRRGWVLFAAMSVIWGTPYLLIKIAVGGVPVSVLVLARVVVGAALLLPIALRRGQLSALAPVWPWVVLFAFVEIVFPWLALAQAERSISSSLTGLLLASAPVIIALLSLAIGGDRLSRIRWIGLLIGLGGVALLAGPNLVGAHATSAAAESVGEVLFVALCYAVGPLIASRRLDGVPPVPMTAVCLSLAAVVYAPLAAFDWPTSVPSAKVLASIAGLAVICTAVAFLIFFRLIAEAGPARASVITYINPAIAVSLGVAVLGERVTPTMLVAFGTILAGSVLATRPTRSVSPGRPPVEAGPRGPVPAEALVGDAEGRLPASTPGRPGPTKPGSCSVQSHLYQTASHALSQPVRWMCSFTLKNAGGCAVSPHRWAAGGRWMCGFTSSEAPIRPATACGLSSASGIPSKFACEGNDPVRPKEFFYAKKRMDSGGGRWCVNSGRDVTDGGWSPGCRGSRQQPGQITRGPDDRACPPAGQQAHQCRDPGAD